MIGFEPQIVGEKMPHPAVYMQQRDIMVQRDKEIQSTEKETNDMRMAKENQNTTKKMSFLFDYLSGIESIVGGNPLLKHRFE